MRIFYIICVLFISTTLSAQRPAWVFGKIENKVSGFIKVEYVDNQLNNHVNVFQLPIQFNGSFDLPLKIKQPTIVKLTYNRQDIHLFVRPKDYLNISFNGQNPKPSLTIKKEDKGYGDNYALQKYIRDFDWVKQYNSHFMAPTLQVLNKHWGRLYKVPSKDAFKYSFEQHAKELEFLENSTKLTSTFRTYFRNFIDYRWFSYQITFVDEEELPDDDKKVYYSYLTDSIVNNPRALNNNAFCTYIDQYMLLVVSDSLGKEVDYKEDWREIYRYVSDKMPNINEKVKSFFLGRLMYMNLNPKSATDIEAYLVEYMNREQIKYFLPTLQERFTYAKRFAQGSPAPNFSLVDKNGVQVSLEDLRGKVVYLTFWANWCDKCIQEMNASAKLLEKYKGQDIAFVYVSLEKTKGAWQSHYLLQKVPGVHLWGEGTKSDIAKKYEIFSLPRHFMIDKQGRFISPFKLIEDEDFDSYIQRLLALN